MREAQELRLNITVQGSNAANSTGSIDVIHPEQPRLPRRRTFNWWLRIAIYALLVIAGQSAATLLGNLYYGKGGKSKWMGTLVQFAGFPILLPLYCIPKFRKNNPSTSITGTAPSKPPSSLTPALVYASLGLLASSGGFLYSVGLSHLPVSTYSLICASQLAFNALFSFFLNSQKLTPYIVNSLVLLTISSTLLVFQGSDSADNPTGVSKTKYAIGFICTVVASAGYGLFLSLTQLAFKRVLRRQTFRVVMDMIVYQSLVATMATLVGLFASGEWNGLREEMDGFELGRVSYVMNLTWTAILWELFAVGAVGLIFEASSLFSNAVSVLGLPVVPVLAVVFVHDRMDGGKAMAMVLAIWGFVSYVYQHYLDDKKPKPEDEITDVEEVSQA